MPEVDKLPVNIIAQGVVTRSVRDTAYYFAMAEALYRNPALPPVGHVTEPGRRRLRIAVMTQGHPSLPTDPEVADAVRDAGALCESLGHSVDEIEFPYGEQIGVDFLRYWALLAFSIKRFGGRLFGEPFDTSQLEPFTLELARMFGVSAERVPGSLRRLRRFGPQYSAPFATYDVVVSPVLAHEPPPIGYLGPKSSRGRISSGCCGTYRSPRCTTSPGRRRSACRWPGRLPTCPSASTLPPTWGTNGCCWNCPWNSSRRDPGSPWRILAQPRDTRRPGSSAHHG